MADEHRSRKRKRIKPISTLLLQHKVEVRSIEEGFEGSWHSATVIDSKNQTRVVKYDNILVDDSSENLVESVPVLSDKYRGRIRPVPPELKYNLNSLHYGQCVDVFHEEAWWDGVVFDHDDFSKERSVFFPDVGDELRVKTEDIRFSRDWCSDTDEWKYRGDWVFLEVLEELEIEWPILVSVKQIWYEVRMKKRFGKEIKEWTCKLRDVWKETVKEVVLDNLKFTMVEFFSRLHKEVEENNNIYSKQLRSRAKRHLLAVGWSMWFPGNSNRLMYLSPDGKKFHSIRQACTHYMLENGSGGSGNSFECQEKVKEEGVWCQEKTKEKGIGKLIIKKKDGVLSIQAVDKRKEKESFLKPIDEETGKSETGNSSRKTRVLRSSKRAREEISPMHQTPRTILSWLIDNSVLLPRSKVHYRCRKDGHTMKEGRVTRDGIKCSCCQTVFSISKFESHAGSSNRRPSANIFLEDGRSLLDCQLQLKSDRNARLCKTEPRRSKGNRQKLINDNDYICTVCHYGGELVLCDQCPSSFHTHCLGITDVPDGDWFCPSCCCRVCNQNKFTDACEEETDSNILNCSQCERRYHIGCLKRKEGFAKLESYPQVNWFCSRRCEEIFVGLNKLLGKPIPVGRDDLTWTIVKHKRSEGDTSNTEELTEIYSKLNIAISVMHECFEPVKEPRTQRDIVEDVIFCRWSELNRLNFKGFYTILLEKDDELVSAASVRIYGEKVAELPLVGTRFRFRRRGMCHALVDELEKMLVGLGVERLVLPAVPSVLNTWTSSFGFSLMTESEKLNFLGYTFLDFQGTHMCQKSLMMAPPSAESSISRDNNFETINGSNAVDLDHISAVSEVSQVERVEESGLVHQRPSETDQGKVNDNRSASAPLEILAEQPSQVECQSEVSVECSMEASNVKEKDNNGSNGHIKCYQRRKTVSCGS
ncbi:agenet-like domain-containing protein [Artemisia annua]|uniref:Agenet-like domain-containing protein n=1 Tax=Artemisia annua TaxID=35608 RepID=A0A2U1P0C9_ARTAN|nr:agenet-like domain-containing protein [Artemisia annua]